MSIPGMELLVGSKLRAANNLLQESEHLTQENKHEEAIHKAEAAIKSALANIDDMAPQIIPYYLNYAERLIFKITNDNDIFGTAATDCFHNMATELHADIKLAKEKDQINKEIESASESPAEEEVSDAKKEDEKSSEKEEESKDDKDESSNHDSEESEEPEEDAESEEVESEEDNNPESIEAKKEKEQIVFDDHPSDEQIIWEYLETSRLIAEKELKSSTHPKEMEMILSDIYLKLGELLSLVGNQNEAISEMKKALNLRVKENHPRKMAEAYYSLGCVLLGCNEKEAIDMLKLCKGILARVQSRDTKVSIQEVDAKIEEADEQMQIRVEYEKEKKEITNKELHDNDVAEVKMGKRKRTK